MPQSCNLEEVLRLAMESEREYKWANAADLYTQVLRSGGREDLSKNEEIQEKIGHCFYRAAFQARTHVEFKRRMKSSLEAYERAAELLDRLKGPKNRIRMSCCRARTLYNRSWVAEESSERKELLDKCWRLEKKALRNFKKTGDILTQGKLCNELLFCLFDRSRIEWDGKQLAEIIDEAVSYGETAIEILSKVRQAREIAIAYCMTSLHCFYGASISEPGKKKNMFSKKCVSYANKSLQFSEEIGDGYLVGLSNWAAAIGALHFSGDMESSKKHVEKMLEQGVSIQDNYVMGVASYQLASVTDWMMTVEEDLEKRREGYREAIRFSKDAVRHLQIVGSDYFIALAPLAKNYFFLAEAETNRKTKRTFLGKAIEAGRESLDHAERSDSPEAIGAIQHELSKALHSLSVMKATIKDKKNMLEESAKHREGYIRIVERMYPSNYWVLGVGQTYQALIKAELAKIDPKKERKKGFLKVAASNMEKCLKSIEKWAKLYPQTRIFAVLGKYYDQFGSILNQLYWLTRDKAILENAIVAYERAVDTYRKAGQLSRLAEAHWNIAKLHDQIGENVKASENFESAAEAYRASAKKILRLRDFYFDYASYMQAWSEIEKARHHHARQEHFQAMTHYEKASCLHKSSKSWKYLASNYLAWVALEHGEDLSRSEKSQEAVKAFRKAAELFREAKRTLQDELERIADRDEKSLASRLAKASDTREGYCLGRVAVEEAKILERLGDSMASSRKYRWAAEVFQKIAEIESGSSRKELLPIIYLCQAWEKMMMAEAKASSNLYGKAAKLFKVAKEHTIDKRTSLLALANSSFCRALEAGTEFEITRTMAKYSTAKRHLEVASSCYLKAGFESASEYTRATLRLFDAYVYMSRAERETDLRTKAQYYRMSRRLLQVSVDSYKKAKHLEKAEEVQRLLESVEEEQQLVISLADVLHAPAVASTTSSFTMPTPTHEKAVGLDKFEHAAIEANLVLSSRKVTAGQNFDLEMQITNVGKETALLTKVEKIFPPDFELVAKPGYSNLKGPCLEMKGKKLDPLGTEEIRVVLRSFDEGKFATKPRIVYVDETGSKMSYEPEPATIEITKVTLPSRVATGYNNLDCLLFGGIPKDYAVIVTSASCDERELLIKRFVEAGARKGQVTFYVTTKASAAAALSEEFKSSLSLFICNPQADKAIESLPNVFKLKGVDNLTDISIAMTSAFRKLRALPTAPRRACIEIISDVLLQHHAVSTRRWLTGFITDLRSKGFTTLAVMNPQMHPSEDVQAILGLFEGQISIYEKETETGAERFLRITKMYNQRYLQSELPLNTETI